MLGEDLAPAARLERTLLGELLRDCIQIADVVQIVREDDFCRDDHRKLWSGLVALWDQGTPPDLATLADLLHRRGHLDDVGSYPAIAQLWDDAGTGAHAVRHARLVRDHALLRRLAQAGHEIARRAEQPEGPAEEVLETAEKLLFAVAQIGHGGTACALDIVMGEVRDHLDALQRRERPLSGLSTGLIDLDALTAGLQASELCILAARPSVGKTALGLQIAATVAECEAPVFFASLEQSRQELGSRLVASRARVDGQRVRTAAVSGEELRRLATAADQLCVVPLYIDHSATQGLLHIAANARRLKLKADIGLVVVDYLQLVDPEDRKAPRQEQVASISRRLKGLARELNVPVLALAQLNRGVEDRQGQRPRLSDLRESGAIEADADLVMLMHQRAEETGLIEIIVAKQRNGPVGEVPLAYDRPTMTFANWSPEQPFSREEE